MQVDLSVYRSESLVRAATLSALHADYEDGWTEGYNQALSDMDRVRLTHRCPTPEALEQQGKSVANRSESSKVRDRNREISVAVYAIGYRDAYIHLCVRNYGGILSFADEGP